MGRSFYSYTYRDLEKSCQGARLLFNWYYKKGFKGHCELFGVSRATLMFLSELSFDLPKIHSVIEASDRTVKFLFELADQERVETVLIPFKGKYTVCLSTQVGCAMGCAFCYTGRQGLRRSLRTEEIVGQLLGAKAWLKQFRPGDENIFNLVFMGQGEPLHNFDSVRDACEIFLSHFGLSFASHKITVSTAGYLPGLVRWKAEMPSVNLALSLHVADNERRSQIIPLNKKFPIECVLAEIDKIPFGEKRLVTYEYLMLGGFNDGKEDAHQLGVLLRGRKAFVNLIPFNAYPGAIFKRPNESQIVQFKMILQTYSIPTTIRTTRGHDVLAACGQLNTGVAASPGLQI